MYIVFRSNVQLGPLFLPVYNASTCAQAHNCEMMESLGTRSHRSTGTRLEWSYQCQLANAGGISVFNRLTNMSLQRALLSVGF